MIKNYIYKNYLVDLINQQSTNHNNSKGRLFKENDRRIIQSTMDVLLSSNKKSNKLYYNELVENPELDSTRNLDTASVIMDSIDRILSKFVKMTESRKVLRNLKSRNLIEMQIQQEISRSSNETNTALQGQIEDIGNLLEKKRSIILQIEKKFQEVEIFARREFHGVPNPAVSMFSVIGFFSTHQYLQCILRENKAQILSIKQELTGVQQDNIELLNRATPKANTERTRSKVLKIIDRYKFSVMRKIQQKDFLKKLQMEFMNPNSKDSIYILYQSKSQKESIQNSLASMASYTLTTNNGNAFNYGPCLSSIHNQNLVSYASNRLSEMDDAKDNYASHRNQSEISNFDRNPKGFFTDKKNNRSLTKSINWDISRIESSNNMSKILLP